MLESFRQGVNTMIVGIDPGKMGAATILRISDGSIIDVLEYNKNTNREIGDGMLEYCPTIKKAFVERVSAFPSQGVKSVFSFGTNFGFWLGLLVALKIPFELVSPVKWQRTLGCLTKGDKNITKSHAQRLYPHYKITHANADSILIAEYGRRLFH